MYEHDDGTKETLDWALPLFGDVYKVQCNVCKKSRPFSIKSGGLSDVKQHARTNAHKDWRKQYLCQRTIAEGPSTTSIELNLSPADSVTKAELLQAMKMVESNIPFAAANGDS